MHNHNHSSLVYVLLRMSRILNLPNLRDSLPAPNSAPSSYSGTRPLKTGSDGADNNLTHLLALFKPAAFIANAKFWYRGADLHVLSHDANSTRVANGDCVASL